MPPQGRWPLVGRHDELDAFAAALAEPATRGLLIHGPPGVGKTRLADECLARAEGGGRTCARATASAAAASLPLSALAHLLPAELGADRADPLTLFERAAAAVRERAGPEPLVLLVDDLHLLDLTSTLLLVHLVEGGTLFLLGTVRSGQPLADALAGLWQQGRAARVDLADLSREQVEDLLQAALDGPVAAGTAGELWTASRGNVLFLRELVLAAQAAGALRDQHGVWRLTGPLVRSARLVELVDARLRAVGGAAGELLELLALSEPVGVPELAALAGLGPLEALERSGLVSVRADGRRQQVTLAHPLYGEVVRGRLPALTRRRLLSDHADRVAHRGARRREDPLRIASWQLDALGSADHGLLVAAARLARYGHDFRRVERLARAALAERPGGETGLLLGEALAELGQFAEAEEVLAAAEPVAESERQLVQIVGARSRNLLWGLLRPADAVAVNRAARARLTDPAAGAELLVDEAQVLMASGHPADSLRLLDGLGTATDLRSRVFQALFEAPALAAMGQAERALTIARQGLADHLELGDQLAIAHPGIHLVTQVYALQEAGHVAEAAALATTGYQLATQDRSPIGRIWFTLNLGRCELLSGRPRTAQRWLAESLALCRDYHFDGPRRLVLSGLAIAHAWLGDAGSAQRAADELDGLPEFGFIAPEQQLGRAWAAAAAGDLPRARALLLAAAAAARESGYRTSEAWLLHDAARLGGADQVAARLEELGAACEGPRAAAYAQGARAAAAQDPAGLTAATDRFETLGAALLAAEAATAAAHAHQRSGQARAAAGLRVRAAALLEGCEEARTPGLVTTAAVVPLTRREREVALLAARGLPSKEIADRLVLSVRTVDNHLQNAYAKLGVTRREQLAAALDDGAGPGR